MNSAYRTSSRVLQRLSKAGRKRWVSYSIHEEATLTQQLSQRQLAQYLTTKRSHASAKQRPLIPKEKLTAKQTKAMKAAMNGESVFIGGAAGCGKTEMILQIHKMLVKKYEKKKNTFSSNEYPITNGVALLSAGARANPSHGEAVASRLQVALPMLNEDFRFVSSGESTSLTTHCFDMCPDFYTNLKVLVIDDIEQFDHDVWHSLGMLISRVQSEKGKQVRPFENIQIIAAGDFCSISVGSFSSMTDMNYPFEHSDWDRIFSLQIELNGSYIHEPQYSKLLKDVRLNGMAGINMITSLPIDSTIKRSFEARSFSEFSDDGTDNPYVDPLEGRLLIGPILSGDPYAIGGRDPHSIAATQREVPGFAISFYKQLLMRPDSFKTYRIMIGASGDSAVMLAKCSKVIRAIVAKRLRNDIQQKIASFGCHFPNHVYTMFWKSIVQVFAIDEEVTLLIPMAEDDLHFGSRGIVKNLGQESVTVEFKTGEGAIKTKEIFPISVSASTTLEHEFVDKSQGNGTASIVTYSSEAVFFPLSSIKMEISSDLYSSIFINGLLPRGVKPPTIILQGSDFIEEFGSLYAAMAQAPSLKHIKMKGQLPRKSVNGPYKRAALFHKHIDGNNLVNDPCPVCGVKFNEPCPGGNKKKYKSAWERITDCSKKYFYCKDTGKTVPTEDVLEHTKQLSLVKCECGITLPLHELRAHRINHISEGEFTCYPQES